MIQRLYSLETRKIFWLAFGCSESSLGLERDVALSCDQAALLGLGGEDDIVALLPALHYEGLAWEHVGGEPSVDRLDALRVIVGVLFLDHAGAESVGAETMQDGHFEAAHG